MSEDKIEQAVVETANAEAKPLVEDTSARDNDDLEKLLSEYEKPKEEARAESDNGPSKPKPEQTPEAGHDLGKVLDRLNTWEEERKADRKREAELQFRTDMDKTIKEVRGDLDPNTLDDVFVEAWLDARARNDHRLAQAWAERYSDPKKFGRVVEKLGQEFSRKFEFMPDKNATEEREAVTAAVRGASTKAPESKPPDFKGMTNNEFADHVAKEHGFRPEV